MSTQAYSRRLKLAALIQHQGCGSVPQVLKTDLLLSGNLEKVNHSSIGIPSNNMRLTGMDKIRRKMITRNREWKINASQMEMPECGLNGSIGKAGDPLLRHHVCEIAAGHLVFLIPGDVYIAKDNQSLLFFFNLRL